jgi:hypothetical protein
MPICPTSRESSVRIVCRSSSTSSSMTWSSCSSESRPATRIISPVSQTWCSTIFVRSSMAVTLSRAGSRRLPGGWKWTSLGAAIWMWPGRRRQVAGGTP